MANAIVRLKNQPDLQGEDQVVIKVQFKQKQYPLPVAATKLKSAYFNPEADGKWLQKTYTNSLGKERNKTLINTRIKSLKTQIDFALDILEELNFTEMSVHIIKSALGKTKNEIKSQRNIIMDSFFEEPLLAVFEKQFLPSPFAQNDSKNIVALHHHLKRFLVSYYPDKTMLMKHLDSKLFKDFTNFLLGYQNKKGNPNDPFTYLTHDTVHKQSMKLRRFRTYCENELRKNMPTIEHKFPYKGTLKVVNPLALYPFELDVIYNHKQLPTHQMETAKKLFFLAYAIGGQRISDISHIVKNKLYKQDFHSYWQKKTRKKMHAGLLEGYFQTYQQDDISLYSGKHINKLLKQIMAFFAHRMEHDEDFKAFAEKNNYQDAFIRKVSKKSFRGRSVTAHYSEEKPISKVISFKNARNTFISTLVFRFKKTREEVMLYTGHSSQDILDYYLDIKQQMDAYDRDNTIIKPDDNYDFEAAQRLNDYNYLDEIGFFNLDTKEDAEFQERLNQAHD